MARLDGRNGGDTSGRPGAMANRGSNERPDSHRALYKGNVLEERFTLEQGTTFLSGIQAIVRALIDQRRLDQRAGLNTAGFVSGYRGSPLGGLDKTLWREGELLDAHRVVFKPGINEDLAATAVWGSQHVGLFPGALRDGVFSLWYGKAPGLDRSCDALRHANMAGTSAQGGVLAIVGDDPGCKSSSLPSSSTYTFADLGIPFLTPVDVQDVLDLSLLGWALSRFTGSWAGLIAYADTMDSGQVVEVDLARHVIRLPEARGDLAIRLVDTSPEQEARLFEEKMERVRRFAEANHINRVVTAPERAQVAFVSYGKTYRNLREALALLGFETDQALTEAGIRLVRIGMPWPLDAQFIRGFARDVSRIVVVEEKRPFIEDQIKAALHGHAKAPVFGKLDDMGLALFPTFGTLTTADVAVRIARFIDRIPNPHYLDTLKAMEAAQTAASGPVREPVFCAGCPHNTSTNVPEGSRASAGIGCHYMAQWFDRDTYLTTHMGAEGTHWLGQAPFTQEPHTFVNLGDGTYFHSGILAIRAALAAKVNVTYKILYNDAVAMTGGQSVDGQLTVADIIRQVRAEGVRTVCIVTDDPKPYRLTDYEVHHRRDLDAVQRRLRNVPGCSVLIYDQTCAAELRRRRKRGTAPIAATHAVINDAICDDCGDCSRVSNCIAVEPLATEFGTKRRVNPDVCNDDLSCVDGFCPAFVTVTGNRKRHQPQAVDVPSVPEPVRATDDAGNANIVLTGIGGTGIVTLSQIIGTAAHLDGRHVTTLDMTGLAQKGGSVSAHVRISPPQHKHHANRVPARSATLLIGADAVTAFGDDVGILLSKETTAIVNSHIAPTIDFILRQEAPAGMTDAKTRLEGAVKTLTCVDADGTARALLGHAQYANLFLLGFAYQGGGVPLTAEAIEQAITLNGVEVASNLAAFRYGRLAAHDPNAVADKTTSEQPIAVFPRQSHTFEERMQHYRDYLRDYQNDALVHRFDNLVQRVGEAEARIHSQRTLTEAAAASYFHLLTVKDEYEVARLALNDRFAERLAEEFEDGTLHYHFAPPLPGKSKRHRKIRMGTWVRPLLKLLASAKGLRGSMLDPFRFSEDRRLDRTWLARFEDDVENLLPLLSTENIATVKELIAQYQKIRGFGVVRATKARALEPRREQLMHRLLHAPNDTDGRAQDVSTASRDQNKAATTY